MIQRTPLARRIILRELHSDSEPVAAGYVSHSRLVGADMTPTGSSKMPIMKGRNHEGKANTQ
jgi:hypothetical protein